MIRTRPFLADTFCGLVVTAFGVAGLIESLRMPRFEERNADPFTAPGMTPGLICAVLTILGVLLVLRGMNGSRNQVILPILDWNRGSVARTIFTIATVLIYGGGLFGHMPFFLATTLFVTVFTVGAEMIRLQLTVPSVRLLGSALALGLVSAGLVQFVFVQIFLVRLPG
jgi:hypothetical protein